MSKKIHDVLLGISVLPALLVMPAFAGAPDTTNNVFVLGDIVLTNQHVAVGEAAFAGRRMNNFDTNNRYQNVFPKYKMVARSFDMSDSDTYVGPVTLTLRELTNEDELAFNYQVPDGAGGMNDVNLVDLFPGLAWNISEEDVVDAGIPQPTAGTLALFAHLDGDAEDAHAAGSLSFKNTKATIDGATINANTISITNGSELTFVKQDTNLLNTSNRFFTNEEDIVSDGVTTLNANTINIANSSLLVNSGATVIFNATDMATLENITMQESESGITNQGNMTINNSSFTSNSADVDGGAIYNYVLLSGGGEIEYVGDLTVNGGLFDSNVAAAHGGAIYNYGTATIDGAIFTGNKTTNIAWPSQGGAIFNSGDDDYLDVPAVTMVISNTTFGDANDDTKGNMSLQGGAIANESSLVTGLVTLNNVNFYYNKAFADTDDSDGYGSTLGGAVWNQGEMIVNGNTMFRGNTATGYNVEGGAIYNSGTLTFNDTVTFDSNVATDLNSGNGAYGGAIANSYTAEVVFKKLATFTDNSALSSANKGTQGGAINNQNSIVFEQGASFTGNTAVYGGAVFNEEDLTIAGGSTFDSNTAADEGGALFTYGGVVNLESATFTNNGAESNGGAIANYGGNITFTGTNTFNGNTAGGVANDIYNRGRITFADGSETTMDGGITGSGILNIASGAELNLGTASITQSSITLDGILNADLKGVDDFAFFDVSNEFGGDGTLNLTIYDTGEYNVFRGGNEFDNEQINVTVSSVLFDWDWNEDFDTIIATMKSTEEIAAENGLTEEAAASVTNLVNSSSEELNDLANAMQDSLAAGDATAVEQAHKAIHPETESVVQSVAMSVQNTVANLASGRLMALTTGRNGGDVNVTGGGIWAQGIYNKTKQNDAFRGYTRGVAAGADMTLDRALTLGAGYSYAHSDISGTARNTEVDSSTIFAYAQYKPTNWFMNAMANYTMSDYSEHADALGTPVDASYDVRAYGGQVMTGYDFAGGITPAVGVRYMHLTADEYKNSLGIKNKLADSDYMTAILETKWTYGFKLNKNLTLRPELRYAVKYDIMSDEQSATILLPGVDSYVLDGNRLSRLGAEFGGGLGMKVNGVDLSLNYDIEIREGFTSQTGRARIRIEF